MGRTIEEIDVSDVEKRKIPSKHYVYVIYVTWSDGSTNIIYRRYSRFFDLQSTLMEMYPEEAGVMDPDKRIIPFLPGKKFFGRSHIREVAVKRLGPIADYCKQIVKLPRRISQCKEVLEFFEMDPDDMNPQKGKKASIKAKKISTPKPLEVYVVCTDYKKQEKGEVTLSIGMAVDVVEKTETGWWFVNAEEEQGWVPSTCLEREDGEKEESTVRFKPGQEEQYLCTEEFRSEGEDELSMERGAVVDVIEKNLEGWWFVRYNGREGYVPATYLMKTEAFQARKKKPDFVKPKQDVVARPKQDLARTPSGGPQIVRSLHEVSDLLKEEKLTPVNIDIDNDFDDTYTIPDEPEEEEEEEEEKIYTIHEISRILKANKQGDEETEKINRNIRNAKSRSLTRGGSIRPPPRPSIKPKLGEKSSGGAKLPVTRMDSLSLEYVTIADHDDSVGDGISFTTGQSVKVLEKTDGGWWYVLINHQEGWAPASYIQKVDDQPEPVTMRESARAKPPSPPPQTSKSKMHSSREDLSKDNDQKESPRRISTAMEGLKDALKAKLPNKDKRPPTPPKKDFLDDEESKPVLPAGTAGRTGLDSSSSSLSSSQSSTSSSNNFKFSFGKSGSSGLQLPQKPPGGQKNLDRGLLHSPPPPPPVGAKNKPEVKATSRPQPPAKVKAEPTRMSKPVDKSDDSEEDSGHVNVAGLAGALKARFEGKSTGPSVPSAAQKPKVERKSAIPPNISQKPTPPSFAQKPKPDAKPVPPNSAQKPKIDNKPIPPTSQKPKVDGLKPVLNKVNFPNTSAGGPKSPKSPGKPFTNKPATSATKPSWAKNDPETTTKPSWVKNDNDTAPKPPWSKPNTDSATKPTVKPATKPAWGKPSADSDKKASWVKHDNDSTSDSSGRSSSGAGSGAPKVSDLASVLKSKFENKGNTETETNSSVVTNTTNKREGPPALPSTENKPVLALKPKPARPGTPPSARRASPGSSKLDPSKYSARPLPPKPNKGGGGESGDPNTNKKPLPSLPAKPRSGGASRDGSDSDDDDARPMGVSGLANALKAKLGAQKGPSTNATEKVSKPLPSVPVKNKANNVVNSNSDMQNNNQVSSENMLNAIADYDAANDGEMSLVLGQQYELLEKADGWWYVSSGSHEGWAPADYLENSRDSLSIPKPKPVQNGGGGGGGKKRSVFRTCSDFTAENEGEISVPTGQEVTVLDKPEGGWWFVEFNGSEGWVPETYLEQS